MSDTVKAAGILGSAMVCAVSLALGEMEFAYAFGGMFTMLLGLPMFGKGLQKLAK